MLEGDASPQETRSFLTIRHSLHTVLSGYTLVSSSVHLSSYSSLALVGRVFNLKKLKKAVRWLASIVCCNPFQLFGIQYLPVLIPPSLCLTRNLSDGQATSQSWSFNCLQLSAWPPNGV